MQHTAQKMNGVDVRQNSVYLKSIAISADCLLLALSLIPFNKKLSWNESFDE